MHWYYMYKEVKFHIFAYQTLDMDRQTIFKKINEKRVQLGVTWLDLTVELRLDSGTLSRMLSGEHDCYMENIWKIMKALKMVLVVNKANVSYEIMNQQAQNDWAANARECANMSLEKLAEQCNVTRVAITGNIKGTTRMRVDTFLKLADVAKYNVEILQE